MSGSVANKKSGIEPHLALVAVQIIFGTWPIVGKVALRALPSTGLVAMRVAGASAAFCLLLRLRGRLAVPRRGDMARLALYGLLGVVLNQFFYVKGLALSTVVNATIISTAIPVFALLVGVLLGFEKLSVRAAVGTLVAAAGVVYLVDPFRADFSGGKALGNLLLTCSCLAYGAYIALSQDVFRRYGALTAMLWVFAFACVATVPVGGYYLSQVSLGDTGWMIWLAVAYIIIVPTVGAYYLNAWALERVKPSTVAVYIYLQPLVALAVAPLVLGAQERWGLRNWVAAALIFAGVAIVTLRSRSRALEEISEHPEALGH
ncbi:MAG TPA: DMT family transporter [Pyrinomonadaceae bacterium]|nr:DMT family transporter [Pyrinomonadaceae bacterium]